jgi:hypothetical protein
MVAALNITGERFGKLTAVSRTPEGRWLCSCECGGTKVVRTAHLMASRRTGYSMTCGCRHHEAPIKYAVVVDGELRSAIAAARKAGLTSSGVYHRIKAGKFDVARLLEPSRKARSNEQKGAA